MPETKGGPAKWLKLEFTTPPALADALANYITESGAEGVAQEEPEASIGGDFAQTLPTREVITAYLPHDVRLEGRMSTLRAYLENLAILFPDLEKVHFTEETIVDPDWGEQWKKYFKPLRASKSIVVKPTWERYSPHGGEIVVEIDPGMAFGTGQHPSTRMCLAALEEILLKDRSKEAWRVLDVGTGTGILGISSAKLGAARVVCVDIDKQAVEIAQENIRINQVDDRVTVLNRDVTTIRDEFDIIAANLTAKLLVKLRDHLHAILDQAGYLIISGILDRQKDMIEEHFIPDAFDIVRFVAEQEWISFVLKKR